MEAPAASESANDARYVSPAPDTLAEGTRDAEGALIHDDLVLSAALTAVLDEQDWRVSGEGGVILAVDPLKEMKGGF